MYDPAYLFQGVFEIIQVFRIPVLIREMHLVVKGAPVGIFEISPSLPSLYHEPSADFTGRNHAGYWALLPSARSTSYQSLVSVVTLFISRASTPKKLSISISTFASCCTTSKTLVLIYLEMTLQFVVCNCRYSCNS